MAPCVSLFRFGRMSGSTFNTRMRSIRSFGAMLFVILGELGGFISFVGVRVIHSVWIGS